MLRNASTMQRVDLLLRAGYTLFGVAASGFRIELLACLCIYFDSKLHIVTYSKDYIPLSRKIMILWVKNSIST